MKDNLSHDVELAARFLDRVEFFRTYEHMILPFRFGAHERARRDAILLRRQWFSTPKDDNAQAAA